jgi:hypothetical protein
MGKKRAELQEQPPIWEIPDDVWPLLQPILDKHYPAKSKGNRRGNLRRVRNGLILRLRTRPMPLTPGALWGRQHGASPLPAVAATRHLGTPLCRAGRDL